MMTSFQRSALQSSLFALFAILLGAYSQTFAATLKAPTLISQSINTRAVAFESVTFRAEPFPLTSTVAFSPDTRTRICVFAMGVQLLTGEGVNAFTADVQDASGKLYPMQVEFMGVVPDVAGPPPVSMAGLTMFILRLPDDLGDVGDVLLRINSHGLASNRVRVAIGHSGGGPSDDPGAVATPAPDTPPLPEPPPDLDTFTGPASDADSVRFLEQATWGPTNADLAHIKSVGFKAYLNEQFNTAPTNVAKGSNYPDLTFPLDDQPTACPSTSPDPNYNQNVCNRDNFSMYPVQRTFFSNALYGPDQLRQRVAFALHQILVVSAASEVNRPSWMTVYLQALDRNAFGNYRTLLNDITLNPAMGEFLDMRLSTRTNLNENYAREVLQLFSVGTDLLNPDGSRQIDSQGVPLPTYTQTQINEFTRAFTGWNFTTPLGAGITNYRDPMAPRGGTTHDVAAKTLFNLQVIPACAQTNAQCAQSDLTAALDNIFNHPNVGPFVSKQLIQHLVTSNPSGAYVQRVVAVFNSDCAGLYPISPCSNARGNLKAVVQAILLDPEARGNVKSDPNYGKLREPAQYIAGFLRSLNVKSFDKSSTSDGVLGNRSTTDFTGTLDQPIFQPPTVFSYYQPGYEVPGTKILGPAFGILSTATTLRRANDINTLVYTGVQANTTPTAASPDRPRGTSIDTSSLEAKAGVPNDVLDDLNALLLHGTMSTQMRNSITTAMNTINDADINIRNQKRVRSAVYLVATSSQYDIQR
jgi:uncharacterized protein (DUF1800 family)